MNTHRPHLIHELENRQTLATAKPRFVRPDLAKTVTLVLASTLSALLLLAAQAPAASFSFSTGDPDGKIGTLSRPPSTGQIQTETADDFILLETTLIRLATFTGLITSVASLFRVLNVASVLYH